MGFVYVVKRTILPSFVRFPIFMSIGFICNALKRKSPVIAVKLFTKIKHNVFFLMCGLPLFQFYKSNWSFDSYSLRKKCLYSELFWFVFSRIRTEYGEIRSISPYSVRMRQNTDQNNSEYGNFLRSVRKNHLSLICLQTFSKSLLSSGSLILF